MEVHPLPLQYKIPLPFLVIVKIILESLEWENKKSSKQRPKALQRHLLTRLADSSVLEGNNSKMVDRHKYSGKLSERK